MEGRHVGTAGERRGADYIAGLYAAAGLRPGGDGEPICRRFL